MLEGSSSSNRGNSRPVSTSMATCSATPLPYSRPAGHRQQPRDLSMAGVAKNRSQSAGSNWEADFARYSDAEQLQKASQHLELTWKVAKV